MNNFGKVVRAQESQFQNTLAIFEIVKREESENTAAVRRARTNRTAVITVC